ncbi:IstB-like ATP-binding protein [Bacillus methanolicus MGA3]|uniref:IstB-like ATP-binding domain-containing protein n=1 Tax=Bacillus methanolicus (strain MGA3 / ATCC 53907) TaxID=796606 RepID=I3E876_BACMM|nr:hypothetical protein BMMGA3_07820 [Bacillus methanolicus MGA3]EIJ82697.1 IstB-like ATP-binding protein [Bacillus methanolicus MGA3]
MGDSIITTAMLDRLLHHSRIFNLKDESYRLKEKQLQKNPEGFVMILLRNFKPAILRKLLPTLTNV